jgi:hypothetical protein
VVNATLQIYAAATLAYLAHSSFLTMALPSQPLCSTNLAQLTKVAPCLFGGTTLPLA